MAPSYKVHAGLALALGVVLVVFSACTLLPGASVFGDGRIAMLVTVAMLFPIFIAAVLRSVLLELQGIRFAENFALMRHALRSLPRAVPLCLAGVFVAAVALLGSGTVAADGRQTVERANGRYYVLDTGGPGPRREHIEVSESEYKALDKSGQRVTFAIPALMSTLASALVLITGRLREPTEYT